LDRNLFERCLRSVQPGASVLLQIRTGERLQKVLDSCARRPHLTDLAVKFTQRLWQPIQRRLFRYSPKSRFANGGLFIALVGGDGAGKTTMLDELSDWLSHEFEVQRLHMGKPEWSFATTLIRGMLKVGTLLHLYRFEGDIYEEASAPHGTPWFLRAACTARDRYLTYLRARRYSTNGGMVLCDRYSLPGFMNTDGPQCEQALRQAGGQSRFHSYLSELEASYYRRIDLPDLMIVLRLDPEIAVQRKVDETQLSVRARSTEVWKRDWSAVSASVVNADQPKEQVLSQIKDIVWAQL
jgi:thymidylate kinase